MRLQAMGPWNDRHEGWFPGWNSPTLVRKHGVGAIRFRFTALLFFMIATTSSGFSDPVFNGVGGADFFDPSRWAPSVPQDGGRAEIRSGTASLANDLSLQALRITGGVLSVDGSRLTLERHLLIESGTVIANGGTIDGELDVADDASVIINGGGATGSIWSSGSVTISGTAESLELLGGTAVINGSGVVTGETKVSAASLTVNGVADDIVSGTASDITINTSGRAGEISSSGRFTHNGSAGVVVVNGGQFTINSGGFSEEVTVRQGQFVNNGTINRLIVEADDTVVINASGRSGAVNNAGNAFSSFGTIENGFTNDGGARLSGSVSGGIINTGDARLELAGHLSGAGTLTNDGSFTSIGHFLLSGYETFDNYGSMHVEGGLYSDGFLLQAGRLVTGDGISGGDRIRFDGGISLAPTAVTVLDVTSAGSDRLQTNGNLTLGGTLNVRSDGSLPAFSSFVIAEAGGQIIGTFDRVQSETSGLNGWLIGSDDGTLVLGIQNLEQIPDIVNHASHDLAAAIAAIDYTASGANDAHLALAILPDGNEAGVLRSLSGKDSHNAVSRLTTASSLAGMTALGRLANGIANPSPNDPSPVYRTAFAPKTDRTSPFDVLATQNDKRERVFWTEATVARLSGAGVQEDSTGLAIGAEGETATGNLIGFHAGTSQGRTESSALNAVATTFEAGIHGARMNYAPDSAGPGLIWTASLFTGNAETSRLPLGPGLSPAAATADFHFVGASGGLLLRHGMPLGDAATFSPEARLSASFAAMEGYREIGAGPLSLVHSEEIAANGELALGARIASTKDFAKARVTGSVAAHAAFSAETRSDAKLAFVGAPTHPFRSEIGTTMETTLMLEASAGIKLRNGSAFSLSASGKLSGARHGGSATVTFRLPF